MTPYNLKSRMTRALGVEMVRALVVRVVIPLKARMVRALKVVMTAINSFFFDFPCIVCRCLHEPFVSS